MYIAVSQFLGCPIHENYSWITLEGNFGMTVRSPPQLRSLYGLNLIKLSNGYWKLTCKGKIRFLKLLGEIIYKSEI